MVVAMRTGTKALFFTAKWCGACRRMYPIIKGLQSDGYDITIVDYDLDKTLVQTYRVRSLPTLVILNSQGEVKRWTGLVKAAKILRVLQKQKLNFRDWS